MRVLATLERGLVYPITRTAYTASGTGRYLEIPKYENLEMGYF